ncbi:MAG: anthranilate phosphoribosyltransferase, partial [Kiritimatiellae bacterium]|nr:anthranilate phosphoribosyltransferase [Kiritimatiellia bacterium]
KILREVLSGKPGAPRDIVLLNAGAALVTAGLAADLRDGAAQAARAVDSGAAMAKLQALIEYSRAG